MDKRKQDNGAKTDQKGDLYRERRRRRVRSVWHTIFSRLSFRQTSWTFFMPMFADPHQTHTWYYHPRFGSSLRQQLRCTSSESGPNPILLTPSPKVSFPLRILSYFQLAFIKDTMYLECVFKIFELLGVFLFQLVPSSSTAPTLWRDEADLMKHLCLRNIKNVFKCKCVYFFMSNSCLRPSNRLEKFMTRVSFNFKRISLGIAIKSHCIFFLK